METKMPLWSPSETLIRDSNLKRYMQWLGENYGLAFEDYDGLWKWSTDEPGIFWKTIVKWFDISYDGNDSDAIVLPADGMIGTKWFPGMKLNYAEHIFRNKNGSAPAIIYKSELKEESELSWHDLEEKVASLAWWMTGQGIKAGDRVCAVLPNIPEAVIAFLAANSVGAVWSSCSPDFGNASIIDRFEQIQPSLLFISDGYTYNGQIFDKTAVVSELISAIPSLQTTVLVPFLKPDSRVPGTVGWDEVVSFHHQKISFARVPFNDPLWVLFSSGTTGKPKAITHSVGGSLIEHFKALSLHQDVKSGERYFWYSTTGWMMWNYALASMLCGTTLVIYEGAAGYPDLHQLWDYAEKVGVNHFGGGAAYYIACMKSGLHFAPDHFPDLRTIGSTGSPLPPEGFEWIYSGIKKDVWLISLSGGTDICSCFVGGNPLSPVYAGEIQCRLLGCDLDSVDDSGKPVRDTLGEMIIKKPMPSMPVFFWNDPGNQRYFSSYFENYPGIWRHGDWICITSRNTIIIYGRSDATLNRDGVRIGTAEIYSAVESLPEITDSLVVCVEKPGGRYYMPLFVVLKEGIQLTKELKQKINSKLRSQYSPRHVPDEILEIKTVPYTLSGKKMEMPVKKILMGQDFKKVAVPGTMKNPESLMQFKDLTIE
ncbi:acetoacetate--CoA ligase [Pollutibacter soli]|uniref:acetoacetate--CoA ligase n=1 Tax=Pollutibacter soli TaxID=3034157 RepID=UPI003013EABA